MTQFQNVPINIIGSSYETRAGSISKQTTKNLYPEVIPTGKVIKALHNWYGASAFSPSVGAIGRGTHKVNDVLYQVAGNTLYSIASNGTRTTIGSITGSDPVVMDNDGENLIITTGGDGYRYNISADTLSLISDVDYEPAKSCAYINTQMIYDGLEGRFQVSDPGSSASINALNYATAESHPDDTIRVYVKDGLLYVFGEESFEIWYNSGIGNPPFDRIEGAVRDIGLISPYAVAKTNDTLYFIGDDKIVYKMIGYKEQGISSPGIAQIFSSFNMANTTAYHVHFDDNEIIVFRFPSEGRTFAYSENTDNWFELTTGANEDNYFGNSFIECYGHKLIEDARNGAIYILSPTVYKNIDEVMIRERVSPPISGEVINRPGQRLLMDRIRFVVEKGVGIPTGQGSDPQMSVSLSFDGGDSWTNEIFVSIYETGQKLLPVDFHYSQEFYECMIKVRMSDPVFMSLHNASIDMAPVSGY